MNSDLSSNVSVKTKKSIKPYKENNKDSKKVYEEQSNMFQSLNSLQFES